MTATSQVIFPSISASIDRSIVAPHVKYGRTGVASEVRRVELRSIALLSPQLAPRLAKLRVNLVLHCILHGVGAPELLALALNFAADCSIHSTTLLPKPPQPSA